MKRVTYTYRDLSPIPTEKWPDLSPIPTEKWPDLSPIPTEKWPDLSPIPTEKWPDLSPIPTGSRSAAFHFPSIKFWRLLAALVWVMKSREAVSVYTTSSSLARGPRTSALVTTINTPLAFNSANAESSAAMA